VEAFDEGVLSMAAWREAWEGFVEGVSSTCFNGFVSEVGSDILPRTAIGLFKLGKEELEGVVVPVMYETKH
jgi:hypothetical protein